MLVDSAILFTLNIIWYVIIPFFISMQTTLKAFFNACLSFYNCQAKYTCQDHSIWQHIYKPMEKGMVLIIVKKKSIVIMILIQN